MRWKKVCGVLLILPFCFLADCFLLTEDPAPTQASETVAGPNTSAPAAEGEETGAAAATSPGESSDEVPHARGPPVVGVEDLGLQDGKGVEMDLAEQQTDGSAGDGAGDAATSTAEASSAEGPQGKGNETSTGDKDGDIVLDDPKPKEETKAEGTTEAGEGKPESAGDSKEI